MKKLEDLASSSLANIITTASSLMEKKVFKLNLKEFFFSTLKVEYLYNAQ